MGVNNGGRFRKKKVGFSMVSNSVIRDDNLSLKAKGLYALIQYYITLEDFTIYKSFIQTKCNEGEYAFDAAWKELKKSGYLKQYKMRDGAKTFYYEYELLDEPENEAVNEGHRFLGIDNLGVENLGVENLSVENLGVENLSVENLGVENLSVENLGGRKHECINNNVLNNNISNNNISNNTNQIISLDDVMDQIGYDAFSSSDCNQVKEIALLMTEILNTSDNKLIRIAKDNISSTAVKERFHMINKFHVEYVLNALRENKSEIGNIKNYLVTMLYNAPVTMNTYYQNKVNNYKEY